MPISDELLLQATTPPDPVAMRLRRQTLRSAMLANDQAAAVNPQIVQENAQKIRGNELGYKLNQEALSQEQIKTSLAQQDLGDQTEMHSALRSMGTAQPGASPAPGGFDGDRFLESIRGRVSPKAYFGAQSMILGTKEKVATLAKLNGEATAAQQKQLESENDLFSNMATHIQQNGYSPALVSLSLAQLSAMGPKYKEHAQQIADAIAANPDNAKAIIDTVASHASAPMMTAQARQTTAQTGAQKQKNEAPIQQADALAKQTSLAGQLLGPASNQAEWDVAIAKLPPEIASQYPARYSPSAADLARRRGMSAEQQTQADQAAATAAQTAKRDAETAGYHRGELGIRGSQLNIERQRFNATLGAGLDANGRPLAPDDLKAAAQSDPVAAAIANYQMSPPGARTSALGKATMAKVLAINPQYDGSLFQSRNKTALDYSPAGKTGQAITSADTALAHLAAISKAGKALGAHDVKLLNTIAQELGAQIGVDPKNTYDTIVSMVAPEISKAVIGGVGGEAERQNLQNRFTSRVGDQVREDAIGAAASLLGARFEKSKHAYEQEMGKPLERTLSKESQQVLQKYSGKAGPAAGAPQYKVGDTVLYQGAPHKVKSIGANGKLTLEN